MTDEWDDYNVRDEPAPRPTRTETVIQAATERVVKAPNVRARALKYGPTTLLGSRGFRALRSQAQNLEWTNDPSRDLDRLMAVYRDWAHRMYPKFVFRDFVDKTEKQSQDGFDELAYVAEQESAEIHVALGQMDELQEL